jgi:hypothetical protein
MEKSAKPTHDRSHIVRTRYKGRIVEGYFSTYKDTVTVHTAYGVGTATTGGIPDRSVAHMVLRDILKYSSFSPRLPAAFRDSP